jgi:hypothetical protein
MAFDRADDMVGIHRVPGWAGGAGVRCVWVERTLRGFAQAPRNLDEIVPGLEQHQHRSRRGAGADRANAAAGKTRLERAPYPVIAFEAGYTEAGTAGDRRMDRQDGRLAQIGSPGLARGRSRRSCDCRVWSPITPQSDQIPRIPQECRGGGVEPASQ